jgi:hypothetical protein
MLCVGSSIFASACGFLDDDIGLSEEEFAASFGVGGVGGSIRGGSSHHIGSRGCGIRGSHSHSHLHPGHRKSRRRWTVQTTSEGPTVIDMDPSYISANSGASAESLAWREARDQDEEASHPPFYAAGEIRTWGDYLEAELQRAQEDTHNKTRANKTHTTRRAQ